MAFVVRRVCVAPFFLSILSFLEEEGRKIRSTSYVVVTKQDDTCNPDANGPTLLPANPT